MGNNFKHDFVLVDSWKQIKQVVEYCKKTGYCSHDFETSGEPYYEPQSYPTMLGISFQPTSSYVIPLGHSESPFKDNYLEILDYIAEELITNEKIVKVAFNAKFEQHWWMKYGWDFRGKVFDPMLMKYLLDEERPHGLGPIVWRMFDEIGDYKEDTEILARKHGWANIPIKELSQRNALDCDLTLRLMLYFEQRLEDGKFDKLFRSMLMPASNALAETEFHGIPIDVPYLDGLVDKYAKDLEQLDKEIRSIRQLRRYQRSLLKRVIKKLIKDTKNEINKLLDEGKNSEDRVIKSRQQKISRYIAGEFQTKKEKKAVEQVNFKSPKQLIEFLFTAKKGLGLPIIKYTKDKKTKKPTTTPSTDESVLLLLKEKDKSGFIEKLLKFREVEHLNSTYVAGMRVRVSSQNKIHGTFLIHGTVTGRLSSIKPNLQNIPRDTTAADIKKMFIPPPGHLLVEVDYGQAELRIAAELSGDEAMIDIFKKNYNIHVATACKMFGGKYEEVKAILKDPNHKDWLKWEKQKKIAKSLNFSILYMQSAKETAKTLGCSEEKAKQFQKEWFNQFPKIGIWMKGQERFLRRHGFVYNMFGRKRRLPDIHSGVQGFENKAIRDSINAPIQGASSDFTLMSFITIHEYRKKGLLPGVLHQPYTVHDSIGLFVEPKHIHHTVKVVQKICENPDTMKYFGFEMKEVKMKVSPEVGTSWGTLKEYDPWENYEKWVNPIT